MWKISLLFLTFIAFASCSALSPTTTPAPPTPTNVPAATPAGNAVVYALRIAEPNTSVDYDRDDWRHWIDEDGDCQNARAEVLIMESRIPVEFDGCRVVSGEWLGLFTGTVVTEASKLDVDHMVPLSNAHRSGAWAWDGDKKREYANYLGDPDHLIAVTASANRSKGDKGPEAWKPPDESYWCEYATDWARIKVEWDLTVSDEEFEALYLMTLECDSPVLIASR